MYLVESESGLMLFDSGTRADVSVVFDYIENILKRPRADLKLVLVSHAHPDHSGGASYFQKAGIPVAGSEKMNEWYKGLSGLATYLVDIFLSYLVWFRKREKGDKLRNLFFPRKVNFDFLLEGEGRVPLFPDWRYLKTPGHTLTDLSFYHEKSGKLYVADNLIGARKKCFAPYPIFSPLDYRRSLETYLELSPKSLLLAHYNERDFAAHEVESILESFSGKQRRHLNTLPSILLGFLKRFFR